MTLLSGALLLAVLGSWGIGRDAANTANPPGAGFSLTAINAQLFRLSLYLAVPGIIAGAGLFRYKPWARTLGIAVSVFSLLRFPWGTALSVYVIWVLVSKECTAFFDRRSREEDPDLLLDTDSAELFADCDKTESHPESVPPASNPSL
jgi:hypothetical protein